MLLVLRHKVSTFAEMIRTFKRKLKLPAAQQQRVSSWVGACRVIHNLCLEIKQDAYRKTGKSPSAYDLMKQLPELKEEVDWIADVPSHSLQSAVDRMDKAYKAFFKGAGFPKFASKKTYCSLHFKSGVRVSGDNVILPKLGEVRMFKDKLIDGKVKTAQIVIEPTGFFVCIQCELPDTILADEKQVVGIDMGVARFATLSDGTHIENPRHFAKYERRLRIENRSLARKKKGSNSWLRQAKKVAMLHHKIGNVRKDFLHKASTAIAKRYGMVCMEDLNVRGMVKNHNLSKHILDCGWGVFRTMLEYKTRIIKVDARYTSQTCNACGTKDKASRISQSKFVCTACGAELNADDNAAQNIKGRGTAVVRKRSSIGQALDLEPHTL
jgi:putative transposase